VQTAAVDEPGLMVTDVTRDRVGEPFAVRELALGGATGPRRSGVDLRGRRLRVESRDRSGLYVRSRRPTGPVRDVAIDATLRAAALRPRVGEGTSDDAVTRVGRADLREKVRFRRAGAALAFVVDASGSMRSNQRMVQTKAAILSLLMNAYTSRDRVALVAFRGVGAQVVLPFTASVELARRQLEHLRAGGKTPLAEGLRTGLRVVAKELQRHPHVQPLMIVVSDGKPNWSRQGDPVGEAERVAWRIRQSRVPLLFVDTDRTWHEPGMGQTLTRITRGRYLPVDDLVARTLLRLVEETRQGFPSYAST
jgi:magnesium chelatase subunit D